MQPRNRNRDKRPDNPLWQEDPAKRLIRLNQRLSHVANVKTVVESSGWRDVENNIRAVIKRKRVAQSSLNWDDKPSAFLAFKEKATFMAGFVQGAEYMLNDIKACLQEEDELRAAIKEVEAQLKRAK